MSDWKAEAREAVFRAAHSTDPEAAPEYRVPISMPWWAFWRKREWETVRGVSRAQLARAHGYGGNAFINPPGMEAMLHEALSRPR